MSRHDVVRVVLPAITIVVVVLALVILTGLASQSPDGFEWAVFDFAGILEPDGGFAGVWSFLGEGPLVEVLAGVIGVLVVLALGFSLFWLTSRKSR